MPLEDQVMETVVPIPEESKIKTPEQLHKEKAKAIYEEKMAKMKDKIYTSKVAEALAVKQISNEKLDKIIQEINSKLPDGKKGKTNRVWVDFNFRCGKIMGLLRTIFNHPKLRTELLEISGLSNEIIDLYYSECGNLPYHEVTTNTINLGRPMNVEATKELMVICGEILGFALDDSDLADITQERWDRLTQLYKERAEETIRLNAAHAQEVPAQYDE